MDNQHHITFSNLVLKGKLRKAVRFVYDREKGGFLQPDKLDEDYTGTVNEILLSVLQGKLPSGTIPFCVTLETYEETPIFIPVNITEETVKLVAGKLLGSSIPGGTDSEALQGWLLKFGESTRLRTSVDTFMDWLVNESPPWAAYPVFMSGRLIKIDK